MTRTLAVPEIHNGLERGQLLTAAPFRFPFIRHWRRSSSMQLTAVRLRKHGGTSERTVEKQKNTVEPVTHTLAVPEIHYGLERL